MKNQKYKISQFVEIKKIDRGHYHVRCVDKVWVATSHRDAISIKRWIQETDCVGPLKLKGNHE